MTKDSEASRAEGRPTRLKICFAGSGGGHVRQLLDLLSVGEGHDSFFVTEDTALGQSLKTSHRTYLVPHFAWGQAKLGAPFRMIGAALKSVVVSGAAILKERPQVLISTGAGAVFFALLWARLLGACVIVVESFARFERPSLFGRLAAPFAHHVVIQSPKLRPFYPHAEVFDPLLILEGSGPLKKDLLFATVGATLPFDRLVDSVAQLKAEGAITEQVLVQTGIGGLSPPGLEVVESLPFDKVQSLLRDARIVVCHGGTGSLITALREGCQVISMPRLAARGEHYDDHQAEITEAFVKRGLVLSARTTDELRAAISEARTRKPVVATSDPVGLTKFLREVIGRPAGARKRRLAPA